MNKFIDALDDYLMRVFACLVLLAWIAACVVGVLYGLRMLVHFLFA